MGNTNTSEMNKKGLLALSPLILFITLYLALSIAAGDFYKVPMTVVFLISSIYAIAISGGFPLKKRIDIFSKGASSSSLMLMLWIYVLAGAFAASAKGMGAIDSTVNLAISVLPASMLLPGLFVASCFIFILQCAVIFLHKNFRICNRRKQCRRIYICLFCVAKRLLGNAPSPFDLHFPMQAAHPFGTLFIR